MSIGSISSSTVSTTVDPKRRDKKSTTVDPPEHKTVADHVAALDDQEPIRSVSTTRGTLVDTYL